MAKEDIILNLGKLKIPLTVYTKDDGSLGIKENPNKATEMECTETLKIKDFEELPNKAKEVSIANNKKLTMAKRMKKEYYIKTIIKK